MSATETLRLGLIGGNITASRSPALHIVAGLSIGRNVSYDLLIPAEQRLGFRDLIDRCGDLGFAGVNVTYPHKEEAAELIAPGEPVISGMGSANTVRFTADGARAFNTDYSGFVEAFRVAFAATPPGRTLLIGTGGVGRAVAFGLASLGAEEILMFDTSPAKVTGLAAALRTHFGTGLKVTSAAESHLADLSGIDGVVNCTPLGMEGRPGSALPEGVTGAPVWAFDAVYTPEHTMFRRQVTSLGARFLSGYELYFHQGIRAFEIFSDARVPHPDWVRRILNADPAQLTG